MEAYRLLIITLLATMLSCSVSWADSSEDGSEEFLQNYRVTLTHKSPDEGETQIGFIVSARSFEVSAHQPFLQFSGKIFDTDKNTITLEYRLRIQRRITFSQSRGEPSETISTYVDMREAGVTSNVRIKLNTPITIYTVNDESVELLAEKVE